MNSSKKSIVVFLNILLGFIGLALPFAGTGGVLIAVIPALMYYALCPAVPLPICAIFPAALLAGGLLSGHFLLTVVIFLIICPPAFAVRFFTLKRMPLKRSVLVVALYYFLLLCGAVLFGVYQSYGAISPDGVIKYLGEIVKNVQQNYSDTYLNRLSEADKAAMKPTIDELLKTAAAVFDRCFIGIFAMISLIVAFLGNAASRLIRSFELKDHTLRQFTNFKVSRIGAGLFALSLVASLIPGGVGVAAINLVYILIPALLLQGIGFIGFLLAKRKQGSGSPGFYYFIVLVMLLLLPTEIVAAIAALFGVVDSFTKFRQTAEQ